jgi:DNA-binding NtrC family response regulator
VLNLPSWKEKLVDRKVEVMVLDDEPVVGERLKDYLEKKGMSVETYTESPVAIERLKEKIFDVIVTDVKMQEATGIDVLLAAKNQPTDPSVILITGYGSFETLREAEAMGAFDYICKPFKVEDIYKKVIKAANKARRHAK